MIFANGKVIHCSEFSRDKCPTCALRDKCRINGKLDVMMDIEMDRLYKKEKVVFT